MLQDWALGLPALHVIGYVLAFLAALLEALPAIGLFIPGQTIVAIVGFLAYQGIVSFWAIALLASLGAILGDLVGYWAGRRYGVHVIQKRAFLDEVNELLRTHPVKTLILGRFNSITRAFAPFVAGANRVSFGRFMFANVIGGVLWGFTWTTLGFLFGTSYSLATRAVEWGIVFLLLVVLIAYVLYRLWHRRVARLREARASARATARALRDRARQQKRHRELYHEHN